MSISTNYELYTNIRMKNASQKPTKYESRIGRCEYTNEER